MFYLTLLAKFTIYGSPLMQKMEIFNESVILLILYTLNPFAGDFNLDPKKVEKIGISLICLTCFNFLVNFYPLIKSLITYLRLCYARRVNKREYGIMFEAKKRRIAREQKAKAEVRAKKEAKRAVKEAKRLAEQEAVDLEINNLLMSTRDLPQNQNIKLDQKKKIDTSHSRD